MKKYFRAIKKYQFGNSEKQENLHLPFKKDEKFRTIKVGKNCEDSRNQNTRKKFK